MKVKKTILLNQILSFIDKGLNPAKIKIKLKISKQKLQYYLNKLKIKGLIEKIGYGTWKTSKKEVANIRGHGFMWHIKLPRQIEWKPILIKKHINFKQINRGYTFQIYFKDNRIWLSKNSIVIYDINSYFGGNAVESKKLAFFTLRGLLLALESKLGVAIKHKSKFTVKTSRNHYSIIKNCLAIQCNKEGKKINVYNEKGLWFCIDDSYFLSEAETLHPETALPDNLKIQRYFNEHKETDFQVTPKFLLKSIQGVTNNQLIFDKNMKSHLKILNKLSKAIDNLTTAVKKQNIKQNIKEDQTNLSNF